MSVFSSLFKLIKSIVSKIVKAIVKFIKKYWVLILIVAVIWFAPVIATYLGSIGAPSWLVSGVTWISTTITPYVTSISSALWSGLSSVGGSVWSAYQSIGTGAQLAIAAGALALLAPEEFSVFADETLGLVIDTVSDVVGSVAGAVASSPLIWLVGGGLLLFFLLRDREEDEKQASNLSAVDASSQFSPLDMYHE